MATCCDWDMGVSEEGAGKESGNVDLVQNVKNLLSMLVGMHSI